MSRQQRPNLCSRRSFLSITTAALSVAGVGVLAACGAGSTATTGSASASAPTTSAAGTAASTQAAGTTTSASTVTGALSSTASKASAAATTSGSTTSSAAVAGAAVAGAAVPTPSPAPPVFGKGKTQILFLNGLGGADGETMKGMLANYVQENPNVAINFQTLGWTEVFSKLDSTLVAGTPPEMVVMHATEIPQYGSRKALQPVDDWFAKGLLPKDDWNPTVMAKATWEGKVQGVPLDIHDCNAYVSTNVVKQLGLDPNKLPTGHDFIDAMQKFARNQKDPATATFGLNLWNLPALATIWQFGGDILSEDGKQVVFNAQPVQDALQLWSDLIYKYQIAPDPHVKYTLPEAKDLDRVAVQLGASWDYNVFKHAGVGPPEVTATLLPQLGSKPVTWMNSHELTIPVGISGAKFDEAKKLIIWISNHNVDWAQSGQPPARTSAQNNPLLQQPWAWEVQAFGQATAKYGRYEISPPGYTQIGPIWNNAINDVVNNKGTVKEILDKYANQIKGIMAQQTG